MRSHGTPGPLAWRLGIAWDPPVTHDGVTLLLEQIDAARAELHLALDGMPEAAIARRPPSGWSVIESVRHLLFAEQAHMGRLFREHPEWSALA